MPQQSATRRLILEAVVTCIEKYGIDKLTTRKIALEAGTNIASINYHFRSKDELLAEALSMTINHMQEDVFQALDDTDRPFLTTLEDVFFYLLDGGLRFPGVSRAHLYKAVVERDQASASTQAMLRLFEGLSQRAARAYPAKDPKMLRLVTSRLLSSIMLMLLAPDFFPLPREYRLSGAKNAHVLAASYAQQFKASI